MATKRAAGEEGLPEAKRACLPSKVVHFRNLAPDTLEAEIVALAAPFGTVSGSLLLKGKGQGFVQLGSPEEASAFVQFYENQPAMIRGRTAYLQFSNRQQLEVTSSTLDASPPSKVLLVTIHNCIYPITIDVVQTVFTPYGYVSKCALMTKNGQFQALVEMGDIQKASAAKAALEGQSIYTGCCTLNLQFSKLEEMHIASNSDTRRDFSKPAGPPSAFAQGMMGGGPGAPGGMGGFGGVQGMMGMPGMGGPQGSPVVIVSGLDPERATTDIIFMLFSTMGDPIRVKILYNKRDTAMVQMSTHQQARNCCDHLNKCPLFERELNVSMSKHDRVGMPSTSDTSLGLTADYTDSPLHRFKTGSKNTQHVYPPCDTLHLANIPPSLDDAGLTALFTSYGPVQNCRFFHNDKKMATLQMGSTADAVHALIALHNYQVEGRSIKVSFAKNSFHA